MKNTLTFYIKLLLLLISSQAFSQKATYIFYTDDDKKNASLYDIASRHVISTIKFDRSEYPVFFKSPATGKVYCKKDNNKIYRVDVKHGKLQLTYLINVHPFSTELKGDFVPDLWADYVDGVIILRDLNTLNEKKKIYLDVHPYSFVDIRFISEKYMCLEISGKNNRDSLQIVDIDKERIIKTIVLPDTFSFGLSNYFITPDLHWVFLNKYDIPAGYQSLKLDLRNDSSALTPLFDRGKRIWQLVDSNYMISQGKDKSDNPYYWGNVMGIRNISNGKEIKYWDDGLRWLYNIDGSYWAHYMIMKAVQEPGLAAFNAVLKKLM